MLTIRMLQLLTTAPFPYFTCVYSVPRPLSKTWTLNEPAELNNSVEPGRFEPQSELQTAANVAHGALPHGV